MPSDIPNLDVKALARDAVEKSNPTDALQLIDRYEEWLESRPYSDEDWKTQVISDIVEALEELSVDEEPTRVFDLGRVVIAASRLISPSFETATRLTVARRLIKVDRPIWAFEQLPADDEPIPPTSKLGWHIRRLKIEALLAANRVAEVEPLVNDFFRVCSTGPQVALAILFRSQVNSHMGRSQEALEDAREGFQRWSSLSEKERDEVPPGWKFLFQLGEVARKCGEFADAIAAFEEGRQLAISLGNQVQAAFLLSEIGYTWRRAGDEERGSNVLREAAKEADDLGIVTWRSRWSEKGWLTFPREGENLADKLSRANALLRKDRSQARTLFIELIKDAIQQKNAEVEHAARNSLAMTHFLDGQFIRAEVAQREAIEVAEAAGDVPAALGYRINLGIILTSRLRRDEAEEETKKAIEIGENLLRSMPAVEMRQTIGIRLSTLYDLQALWSAVEYTPPNSTEALPPRPDRVFAIGQRMRAVNLTRWLALGEVTDQLANQETTDLLMALRAADVEFEEAAQSRKKKLAPLAKSQVEAHNRWTSAIRRHLPAWNEEAWLCEPSELLRALPNRCFVDLLSLPDIGTINVLDAKGQAHIHTVEMKRESRAELLKNWKLSLNIVAKAEGRGKTADQIAAKRLDALNGEVDKWIMEPIARAIDHVGEDNHVVIFPHRELFQAPFWRLDSMLPGITLSILPSPTCTPILARRNRSIAGPWVAFGDVTGRLPQVGEELKTASFDEICNPSASIVSDHCSNARLLHFAGHGTFDHDNSYRSGILAAAEPFDSNDPFLMFEPADGGHRVLTIAWIIARLRLPTCHTVVLSACHTGLPREHAASEFSSLPAALLVAGTRNIIASLWPAHDAAARVLMQEFYREMPKTASVLQPSLALKHARRRLREMSRKEVLSKLDPETPLPAGDRPFARSWASDVFQHYGVD